ncbi:MAG: aminoglycoside phosphotransferase family protein [Minisyncoccales bacterium]
MLNNIKTMHELNLDKINKVFPNEIKSWTYHNDGFDSYVYSINDEWIFKIPKRDEVWESLKREKDFLDYFFEISPSNVPNFEFFGERIVGYKKISGKKLANEFFESLDEVEQNLIVNQFGIFLKTLHSSRCQKQTPSEYRNFFNKEGFISLATKIQKIIIPKVSKNIQNNINDFLQKFQKNERNFQNQQGSVHADLYANNVLWDTNKKKLGVIDFGDVAKSAVVKDFTLLLADYCNSENDLLLKNLLKVYSSQDHDLFRKVKEFSKLEKLYWPVEDIEDSLIDPSKENDFERNLAKVIEVFKNKE